MKNQQTESPPLKEFMGLLNTKPAVVETAGITTSSVHNNVLGECPVCFNPMRILDVNGVASYTCIADRICLPTANT